MPGIKSTQTRDDGSAIITLDSGKTIQFSLLSQFLDDFANLKPEDKKELESTKRIGKCHPGAALISQILLNELHQKCDVVSGRINFFDGKASIVHSWVEANLSPRRASIIDYTMNVIMNKDGYELLNHIEELNSIIQANHLEGHVFFLPILTTEELGEYQRGAFLSILNKTANVQNIHGFSNKLGEILLSGTPIITTNIGEAPRWFKDGESAYISKSHKPEDIADQIVRAFLDDENRVKIRENGKKIAERYFNTKYQGKRIVAYLKEFFA